MTLQEQRRPEVNPDNYLPADGAELFVAQLMEAGVEALYINSGTDTFPVQEAIAKRQALGLPIPRVVLCLDEMVAGAAAHGHFMITGKPQAVLVHVDVGTQQIGGAIHNAQRGRAGMLVCAGRSPATVDGENPWGRSSHIHWIQEQLDQHGIVRNYTKWDYELRRTENVGLVVQRALQIAETEPPGPVYMTLPRESLQGPTVKPHVAPADKYKAIPTPGPRPELIKEAAQKLAVAQSPLIVAGYSGRNPEGVAPLVTLAEMIGAPVYTHGERMCFPNTHPLWADTGEASNHIESADVVLFVDIDVPYIPSKARPREDATIIHIDLDPLTASIPLLGFPIDIAIQADSVLALEMLADELRPLLAGSAVTIQARSAAVEATNKDRRERYRQIAASQKPDEPISAAYLVATIAEAIDETWTVIDESVGTSGWIGRLIPRTRPGTLFKSGGSSLGWALGASLGAKIADPIRKIITIVGDGTFVYGCPTASLWAADMQKAPFLTIIVNNRMHNASRNSMKAGYPDSVAWQNKNWVGMEIDPPPDYATLATASRAAGFTVHKPSELRAVLDRAIAEVEGGRAAVVDVHCALPS